MNSSVIVGSDVYFMIVVKNTGDCDLSGIKVTEIFNSTELNYVNHSKRDLWVRNGDVFAYQGVLARGESANFTVWFATLVNCTVLNTVNASSNLTGNKSASNNTVVYRPNMSVSKLTLNNTVRVDDQVVFTVVVTNTGDCDLVFLLVSILLLLLGKVVTGLMLLLPNLI